MQLCETIDTNLKFLLKDLQLLPDTLADWHNKEVDITFAMSI